MPKTPSNWNLSPGDIILNRVTGAMPLGSLLLMLLYKAEHMTRSIAVGIVLACAALFASFLPLVLLPLAPLHWAQKVDMFCHKLITYWIFPILSCLMEGPCETRELIGYDVFTWNLWGISRFWKHMYVMAITTIW
jgi:hypothetical protein